MISPSQLHVGSLVHLEIGLGTRIRVEPGEIVSFTHDRRIARVKAIARIAHKRTKVDRHLEGKEFIRYVDSLVPIQTSEDFFLIGIDNRYLDEVRLNQNSKEGRDSNDMRSTHSLFYDSEKRRDTMILKMSSIPVSRGRGTSGPAIGVRENGQIGFNTVTAKAFDGYTQTIIDWDKASRVMTFTPVDPNRLPKGRTKDELFEVNLAKGGQRYITKAGIFKLPDINYDYGSAGSHSFDAKIENGVVTFILPAKMDAKPKQSRKRKDKNQVQAATASATGEPDLQPA